MMAAGWDGSVGHAAGFPKIGSRRKFEPTNWVAANAVSWRESGEAFQSAVIQA